MDFIAFPIHTGARGWLARSNSPEESILQLLKIMASTPQRGWRSSEEFGLRDTLAAMLSKHDARLAAIKQVNAALEELGIDWVSVENIQFELSDVSHRLSYIMTLSYVGKGSELHRLEV
jgi:hypothetical protein